MKGVYVPESALFQDTMYSVYQDILCGHNLPSRDNMENCHKHLAYEFEPAARKSQIKQKNIIPSSY